MTRSDENSPPPLPNALAKYPTPLHIYFRERLLEDATELESGLKSGLSELELYFSTKTNSLLALLRDLVTNGWSMEVVSNADIESALRAGSSSEKLLLNGFAWTKPFLEKALFERNIRRVTIDSFPMATKLRECVSGRGACLDVAVRIHDGDSHFGIPGTAEAIQAVLKELPRESIRSLGLHLHRNPKGSAPTLQEIAEDFQDRALRLLEIEKMASCEFAFFDLGGGIDSPWVFRPMPEDLGLFHHPKNGTTMRELNLRKRFSLRAAGQEISAAVKRALSGARPHKILFEPGRAVCSRALSTLIEVITVKRGLYPDGDVVITNGNTALLGPIHRAVHPLHLVTPDQTGTQRAAFIYGNLPHSGDWLFQNITMPEIQEGDRLLISHTGAYFLPLESNFGLPRPGVYEAVTGALLRSAESEFSPGLRDSVSP